MKKVFALLMLVCTLFLMSCTEECDCEVRDDGTIDCPC